MSAQPIVVTGTDTGVGKTWVSCSLIKALRDRGQKVVALKPIETGCAGLMLEDGVALAQHARQAQPGKALIRFTAPLAPPAAAELEKRTIDFEMLLNRISEYLMGPDVVLIEGAGGLLSPLTWQHSLVDIAKALGAPVVVVAGNRLGVLNQLRLTLTCARGHGLKTLMPVMNQASNPTDSNADEAMGRNAQDCRNLADIGPVIKMPFNLEIENASRRCAPLVDQILSMVA